MAAVELLFGNLPFGNLAFGKLASGKRHWRRWLWLFSLSLPLSSWARGQTCQTASDMDNSVRSALETTAKRFFDMSARGDVAALKQNSIASVASNFAGIEAAIKENQSAFSQAKATVRPPYLLTADGPEPLARAEFLCGVFGSSGQTKNSAVFVLNNLPPGRYGVAVLDVSGGQGGRTLTLVLQLDGNDWKMAGFTARPTEASGHDGAWFTQRARNFKAKGQNHSAWLYYREALALSAPADFMSTLTTDQLIDGAQATQPADLPANGKTVDMSAGGKTYRLTDIFPRAEGADLEVEVRYEAADVSNTARAFQDNTALIRALVAKFPEFREAFTGVVARAVDHSGRDYGTLLAMKDIK